MQGTHNVEIGLQSTFNLPITITFYFLKNNSIIFWLFQKKKHKWQKCTRMCHVKFIINSSCYLHVSIHYKFPNLAVRAGGGKGGSLMEQSCSGRINLDTFQPFLHNSIKISRNITREFYYR
jgi:hypothetical protein